MISCVHLSCEREQTLDFSAVAFGEKGSLPGSIGRGTDQQSVGRCSYGPNGAHPCEVLLVQAYGAQAVVVSIDPRRVYVADPAATERPTVKTEKPGPNGEQYCW